MYKNKYIFLYQSSGIHRFNIPLFHLHLNGHLCIDYSSHSMLLIFKFRYTISIDSTISQRIFASFSFAMSLKQSLSCLSSHTCLLLFTPFSITHVSLDTSTEATFLWGFFYLRNWRPPCPASNIIVAAMAPPHFFFYTMLEK